MRKIGIGFFLFTIIAAALYLRFRHPKGPEEIAYAGDRQVTLWSTSAQVREPIATVTFGNRLRIVRSFEDQVEVRTDAGQTGWVNSRELLSSEVWDQARDLAKQAGTMSIEARGHTAVLSNLHIQPGRQQPRVDQLTRGVPLLLLERRVVDYQAADGNGGEEEVSTAATDTAHKEDWWLVLAKTSDGGAVAGWMLGRFIELDVPEPLPDYADSAGVRIVSWFELNRVPDGAGSSKPQYLVLGARGPEGQPCDFSEIRVYTWSTKHQQYETAFVDNSVCGKLPLSLKSIPAAHADITFSFQDLSGAAPEQRTYRMEDTIVRRVGLPRRQKYRVHR
ncbi:MAG TPA: SH3 domain-containing protein [Candidatus Acidoferrum sp.]|nr:SH3 domain-containing protein [Candidatus Acidoferrum sp.]